MLRITKLLGIALTFFCVESLAQGGIERRDSTVKIRPYREIITNEAISQRGLLGIHKVGDRFLIEIPDSLLERPIFVVCRITKAAAHLRVLKYSIGYGGDLLNQNVICFSKGPSNRIFIRQLSYFEKSVDSSENGMYRSFKASDLQAIVASFPVKTISPNGFNYVLDCTDYLNSDNNIFFFDPQIKTILNLGPIQSDKSYISFIHSFPENTEIATVKTYTCVGELVTYELNTSLILLPASPMREREFDPRVGYFYSSYLNFDRNPQGTEISKAIRRWRLEPKPGYWENYLRGELVEPKKPIVFYIDPATPKKWVPFLIAGVKDWQKAFEKAGFKNAIYAREAPTKNEDSTWSLEDARYSAIVYKSSEIKNASGPPLSDPRTGEILESHINWYHNIMQLLHEWYFVQASPIDPRARKMEFDDSLMGNLIKFVITHEVGHTLGLQHNFGSSSTIPVDSLRDKMWVETNGICPSIMDYARFNYVAQPEDSIGEKGIFPRIGKYDEWAIEWGYRCFPEFNNDPKRESEYLNQWVKNKTAHDPKLWFGSQGTTDDPRTQSEDLGDNAMKAGEYGIRNLKRIIPNLIFWTNEAGKDYTGLKKMYVAVYEQYSRYIFHVTRIIGGFLYNYKRTDEPGNVIEFPNKEQQKIAIKFLTKEFFETPYWLLDKKMYSLGEQGQYITFLDLQKRVIGNLISNNKFRAVLLAQVNNQKLSFPLDEYFSEITNGVFSDISRGHSIDMIKRNLQKTYISQLVSLLSAKSVSGEQNEIGLTDVLPEVRACLKQILNSVNKNLPLYSDKASVNHLEEIRIRIKFALSDKGNPGS